MKEKLSLKAFKRKRFVSVKDDRFIKGGGFSGEGATIRRCPPPIEEKIKSTSN